MAEMHAGVADELSRLDKFNEELDIHMVCAPILSAPCSVCGPILIHAHLPIS